MRELTRKMRAVTRVIRYTSRMKTRASNHLLESRGGAHLINMFSSASVNLTMYPSAFSLTSDFFKVWNFIDENIMTGK